MIAVGTLSALIAVAAMWVSVAKAHHLEKVEAKIPAKSVVLAKSYEKLYAAAERPGGVSPGRNVVRSGRASDGRLSWPLVVREWERLYRGLHPGAEVEHTRRMNTPEAIWARTKDPKLTAEAVWNEQNVPESERSVWRCIIQRESGWQFDVWYGGARGWQPQYAGTDRVNGIMQMRPYHADLVNDAVVSYATFQRTSYPPFALRKALRLGFGPFYAQRGSCL